MYRDEMVVTMVHSFSFLLSRYVCMRFVLESVCGRHTGR